MSYLVLALGVLLSLCGALAIHAGYGIIQVERGWASVIAGAMALSSGIVTVALGLILHRLSGLHALLKTRTYGLPRRLGLAESEAGEARPKGEPAFDPNRLEGPEAAASSPAMPPPSGMRAWPQRPLRSNLPLARNVLKSRGKGVPGPVKARDAEPDLPLPASLTPSVFRDDEVAFETPPEPSLAPEAAAIWPDLTPTSAAPLPTDENLAPHPEKATEEAPPALEDHGAEAPAEAQDREIPAGGEEPAEHSGWLPPAPAAGDPAGVGVPEDLRVAPDAPEASAGEPPAGAFRQAGFDFEPPAPGEPASASLPPSEPSLPEGPAASGENLAIVGRYESDGTSYVMYADGSIEARTEHAVFHFQSMAELKSFMESQGQKARD